MTAEQLNNKFKIPGVSFDTANGGFTRIAVSTELAEAHVYLYGAHITHFAKRGEKPLLFLTPKSFFEKGKPIRGGVPICFPWFGPHPTDPSQPIHGWARLIEWELDGARAVADKAVELTLSLVHEQYHLRHIITIGSKLQMALEVKNLSQQPVQFSEALHTYLQVSDVRNVALTGLEGVTFHTKVKGQESGTQGKEPMRFARETDQVYHNTTSTCAIHDPGLQRRITVAKQNSGTTVVWNAWSERARLLPDLGDDEWPEYLCVETANAFESAVTLEPGQVHTMRAIVSSEHE